MPSLNRTRVELKLVPCDLYSPFILSLNRTRVELKRATVMQNRFIVALFESNQSGIETICISNHLHDRFGLNRTRVELKPLWDGVSPSAFFSLNRTRVELKPYRRQQYQSNASQV